MNPEDYVIQAEVDEYVSTPETQNLPKEQRQWKAQKTLRCAVDILDVTDIPDDNTIVLGEPFLRKYYSVYDRDNMKVGLAKAVHKVDIDKLKKEWRITLID